MNALHGQRTTAVVAPGCPAKPDRLFDRQSEWAALTSFAGDPHPGTDLGVVMGRRKASTAASVRPRTSASASG
ncbi:hypothetical protein, partial [Streptomyces sp. CB01580]|uniref:hypothetical protein n=1 Tax=Streptomyces sp. CB01580 TaxID=1703933 RepID=UPI000968A51D